MVEWDPYADPCDDFVIADVEEKVAAPLETNTSKSSKAPPPQSQLLNPWDDPTFVELAQEAAREAREAAEREAKARAEAAQEAAVREAAAREAAEKEAKKAAEKRERAAAAGLDPDEPVYTIAFLFPDQGSHCLSMLCSMLDNPRVTTMLDKSKTILGFDIIKLCRWGPEATLAQSRYCQPAVYLAGLAAIERLRTDAPECFGLCQAVAGLSLGEYTALTVAGVFDFEIGLRLVKLRAEAMEEAAKATPQAMVSVAGLDREELDRLCVESRGSEDDVCEVAYSLFPDGHTCSGSADAMQRLLEKVKATGCLQAKLLQTAGAFHTRLMEPAKAKMLGVLQKYEPKMRPPRFDVYMNSIGGRLASGTPPSEVVQMLSEQLTSPVLWEKCVRSMLDDGVSDFFECGMMKQLKVFMKRIDTEAFEATTPVEV